MSVHGWTFTPKQHLFFKHARISMEIARPVSRLTPVGKDTQITGVLDGHDVRPEDPTGKVLAEHKARTGFTPPNDWSPRAHPPAEVPTLIAITVHDFRME